VIGRFCLLAGLTVLVIFSAYAVYLNSVTIQNVGNFYAVGISAYQDPGCTQNLTQINWGTIYAGNNATYVAYLLNTGNEPVNLTLTVGNWTPSNAANFINLTWNYNGAVCNPGQVMTATFTLQTVYAPYPQIDFTSFSFDITVTASQV
jgi:hypothetical protein